jgi:hypothetical protein
VGKLTQSQIDALHWLESRGGDGCFTKPELAEEFYLQLANMRLYDYNFSSFN